MLTREQVLVKKIKEWTGSSYIGDDCAVLADGKLVSSDTLVEGTHFRLDFTDWRKLGWKSCAVNLSDVAAMAGRPRYLTVALTLPGAGRFTDEQIELNLEQFYEGFRACASAFGAEIVGGDLTVGRDITVSVTVIGDSNEAGLLLRRGAQVGDVVIVTGEFGSSAAGLHLLLKQNTTDSALEAMTETLTVAAKAEIAFATRYQSAAATSYQSAAATNYQSLLDAHLEPKPRLTESWALVSLVGSRGALMDASDGLGDALWQICDQSKVDMQIDLEAIPLNPALLTLAAEVGVDPCQWALYGGEDYELVATISPSNWQKLEASQQRPFKKIGVVVERPVGTPDMAANTDYVRLLESGHATERLSGVVNLSNCFKHF